MSILRRRKKLGEVLVDLKVLTPTDVTHVLEVLRRRGQRQKFGQMARDMGLVSEEHILAALAVQMNLFPGIRTMNLKGVLRALQTPLSTPP
jgi:hypothetical protein